MTGRHRKPSLAAQFRAWMRDQRLAQLADEFEHATGGDRERARELAQTLDKEARHVL